MKTRTLAWAGAILLGLLLGGTIRRVRAAHPSEAIHAPLPAADRVDAAVARSEIRDLDRRLGALKDEEDRLEREKARLSAPATVDVELSPPERVRAEFRARLEQGIISQTRAVSDWLKADPANMGVLIRVAAEVLREKDRGPGARETLKDSILFMANALPPGPGREKAAEWVAEAQASERDPLARGWMLSLLDHWKVALPKERVAELARDLKECAEPSLREGALAALARNPEGQADVLREALKSADARSILKAWELRALPAGELRAMVRDVMRSDAPGDMIEASESWVPKFLNPFAPHETVGLFNQTLSKPIAPYQKAVSLMVMGSLSTVFPNKPGRAELAAFAQATDDKALKAFAGKVAEMIDQGKTFDDIRRLDPASFGITYPR